MVSYRAAIIMILLTQSAFAAVSNSDKNTNTKQEVVNEGSYKSQIIKFNLLDKSFSPNIMESSADIDLLANMLSSDNTKNNNSSFDLESDEDNAHILSSNQIALFSLIYINNKKWSARVNDIIINQNSEPNITNDLDVLRVEKDSIIFFIIVPNDGRIKNIEDIISKKHRYYKNYNILQLKDNRYISFRLFVGQRIDLQSMLMSDVY